MTQEDLVLIYLRKHKGITGQDANDELGIQHLPKVISNLAERGHEVIKVVEYGINKHTKNPTHWARYFVSESRGLL